MKSALPYFIGKIEALQSRGDRYFPAGIFPAQRINPLIGYQRQDTTIFFSAITSFTLQSIRPFCDAETQVKIDLITEKVRDNYADFQNKDGLKTYNFWKTKPSKHFPNGYLFHRHDHFRIPDDIDDTAFVYLTTQPSAEELHWLKDKLALHANGTKQWIRNVQPEYRELKAYSTWFGKTMYIEFDVSVLCNMLYCVLHYKLPWNAHDEDSVAYIRACIESDRYITEPFRCAHQYPRTPLIMYHVARLIGRFDPAGLRPVKQKLVSDIQQQLMKTKSVMDKVILSTALMQLGIKIQRIAVENLREKDFRGFYFFIAGLLTAYENPLLYKLAEQPIFHMHWVCEAHCWTLLAEYEALWNNFDGTVADTTN